MTVGVRIRNPNGTMRFDSGLGWWGLIVFHHSVARKTANQNATNIPGGSVVVPNILPNMQVFSRVRMDYYGPLPALAPISTLSGNQLSWYWPSIAVNNSQMICLGADLYVVSM